MHDWTLVTGSSGFVGSRLVRELVSRGERVKAFVRAGSNLRLLEGLPRDRFQLAYGDILVEHTVFRALASCSRLYHVATNFAMWDKRPERIMDPAVQGTRAVLEAARRRQLQKVVVTSSAAVLGTNSSPEPLNEEHEFNLTFPETYVRAKHEAQKVALEMADQVPLVLVLPSAIVGPGDWKPTPTGRMLLRYLRMSPSARVPITGGGMNLVDVDDVVHGHILAMEHGVLGERYNLAGEDLTFEQLFATLSDITGLAPPGTKHSAELAMIAGQVLEWKACIFGGEPLLTRCLARDYADTYVFVSSAKAARALGYAHRPAREALSRAVQWFLEKGYVPEPAARRVRLELRPA